MKPIFFYCVMTSNRGDKAIRASVTRSIHKYCDIPVAYFNVKYDELTEKRIEQINNEASILLIGGSGLYTNYKTSSGWYFPCKTELFNKIKVPIVLVGIGCNNNLADDIYGDLSVQARESIKLINEQAVLSSVRDKRTYDMLTGLGITKHKLIPDPALFLDVKPVKKEQRVAINISQHIPLLGRYDGRQDIRDKNIQHFSHIVNYLTGCGYSVVFIAHDVLEQSIIEDLKKNTYALEYINTDMIDDMLREYARCEFSIGIRMHSNILSLAAGTPFIAIGYDQKSIEFCKLLGILPLPLNILDYTYEELLERCRIQIESKNVSDATKLTKEWYKEVHQKFIQRIVSYANGNKC